MTSNPRSSRTPRRPRQTVALTLAENPWPDLHAEAKSRRLYTLIVVPHGKFGTENYDGPCQLSSTIHHGVNAPSVVPPDLLNPKYPDNGSAWHATSITNIANTPTPDELSARYARTAEVS